MTFKGFITNLGKYNEGELVGKWVLFPIENEAEVLEEIGICGEYEEYFFTDFESDIISPSYFDEYSSIEELNEIAEALEHWSGFEEIAEAVAEVFDESELVDACPDDFTLLADINNEHDLGYYWIVESGCYSLESPLSDYFDYEKFGRDVSLETDGAFSCNGWIERN